MLSLFRSRAASVRSLLAGAVAVGLCATVARADLFGVNVDGSTDDVSVTGSSLLDLARNVADQQGQFSVFENQSFVASFNYAGLQNAVVVTSNSDNSVLTLDIPSIGYTKTFDESEGDLGGQIEDFLRQDGSGVLADFISVVNKQTLVGVTDGNPTALTALLANDAFRNYGEMRNPFTDHPLGSGTRLYLNGGAISTDVGDGHIFEAALSSGFAFTERVGLSFSTPVSYRNLEDSETFTMGFIAGLPIRLTPETTDDQPMFWQVTPNFHMAGGGSADQLSGGLIIGGGVTNLVGVKLGDFFLSSGQHLSGYGGQPIDVGDYTFETEVGQGIFKGSASLTYGGFGESAFLQGGLVYTDFLDDAAVDNYVTPFAGLGLKLGSSSVFRIGYSADLADGFTVHRGEVEFRFAS